MKRIFLILIFLFTAFYGNSQEIGFMGIHIGMSREEVLSFADAHDLLHVPKNRDVEFFPVEERKILSLSVEPEVPHMYLQFYNNKLYAITVIFNERYMDYFTLIDTIESKYGKTLELTPIWRKWKVGEVEIKVEKPAVVKYIALEEFLEVTDFKGQSTEGSRERRQILLDGL